VEGGGWTSEKGRDFSSVRKRGGGTGKGGAGWGRILQDARKRGKAIWRENQVNHLFFRSWHVGGRFSLKERNGLGCKGLPTPTAKEKSSSQNRGRKFKGKLNISSLASPKLVEPSPPINNEKKEEKHREESPALKRSQPVS